MRSLDKFGTFAILFIKLRMSYPQLALFFIVYCNKKIYNY